MQKKQNMSQKYDQFFSIATEAAKILCPGKRYEPIKLIKGEKGIEIDDGNDFYFLITFQSGTNCIHVQLRQGDHPVKNLCGSFTRKLGSVSVADIVDAARKLKTPELDSPFASLLKK